MAARKTKDARISNQTIRRYRRLLDRQADKASDFVGSAIDAYMRQYPGASVAQVRKFTFELMQDALPNFTDIAETLSCEFMAQLAQRYGWEDVQPQLAETTDYELVDKRLHYLAGHLADGDVERYRKEVLSATRFFIMRSANDAMLANCRKYTLRYARVPSGFETCSFCFMLASRGFVYTTESKAGEGHKFHPNCSCTVVPGEAGHTRIDGYDPAGMAQRWEQCAEAIGSYDAKAVMREVETRDWHWLYTGKAPKVGISQIDVSKLNKDQRRAYDKESNCANVLALNGFRVEMTDNPLDKHKRGNPKFDYLIGDAGTSWEAKCPEGSGYLAIAGNIAKANAKFLKIGSESRVVISNLDSGMSDKQFWDYFEESLSDPESDYSNVSQILFVFKDKTVKKWSKK